MKTPHKHADLIHAWADGAKIEYFNITCNKWEPIFQGWSWDSTLHIDMRIKPEPKPDVIRFVTYEWNPINERTYGGIPEQKQSVHSNLKLTFDGETGKLKLAEVI